MSPLERLRQSAQAAADAGDMERYTMLRKQFLKAAPWMAHQMPEDPRQLTLFEVAS